MARAGIEPGTSRLIAGYLFHCAIMAHQSGLSSRKCKENYSTHFCFNYT